MAKYVVGLGEKVAPVDIEEGMRVAVDLSKHNIQVLLFFSIIFFVVTITTSD
jgi:26S proteasome regulatory subunit T1